MTKAISLNIVRGKEMFNKLLKSIDSFTYIAVVGATDLCMHIPGISLANQRLRIKWRDIELLPQHLPLLEAEVLLYGIPITIDIPLKSPEGAVSPAYIVHSLLRELGVHPIVVNSGLSLRPRVPYIVDLWTIPSGDIVNCKAVQDPLNIFWNAYNVSKAIDVKGTIVVIGESIVCGTTTASLYLEVLGYRALDRVSSSLPTTPLSSRYSIYSRMVYCIEDEVLAKPLSMLSIAGDATIATIAGLAMGFIENGYNVILGGGTKMIAVLALLKELGFKYLDNIAIITTEWVYSEKSRDLFNYFSNPLAITSIDVSKSRCRSFQLYSYGYVKEGLGMGAIIGIHSTLFGDYTTITRVDEGLETANVCT